MSNWFLKTSLRIWQTSPQFSVSKRVTFGHLWLFLQCLITPCHRETKEIPHTAYSKEINLIGIKEHPTEHWLLEYQSVLILTKA